MAAVDGDALKGDSWASVDEGVGGEGEKEGEGTLKACRRECKHRHGACQAAMILLEGMYRWLCVPATTRTMCMLQWAKR